MRPSYFPETVKTEADAEKFVRGSLADAAAAESRRLTLPQKPEDFKLELPKDFKPPQGIEFKPNEADPLLPQAKAFALKHHLSQEAFSELVGLHAAGQIGTQQSIADARAAEVQKLGVNGTARKTAVDTWLKAQLGDDDLAKHMSDFMFSARQVEGFEKLIQRATNQGASSFSTTGREPPPGNGKIAGYDSMTFEQKRAAQDRANPPPAR